MASQFHVYLSATCDKIPKNLQVLTREMVDYFVVFDQFPGKFADFVVKLLIYQKYFAYCGFPKNFIDVISPNSRVESKFLLVWTAMLFAQPRPCPRLLTTSKAWLLSTRLFYFNCKVYGVFRSDNLEKLGKKNIFSWRCHKFKRKRRYSKWNFTFFRLDKCERWQQLLRWCFETLIVCPCLLIANTTLLACKTLFLFFPKSALPNWECGLSTDAAYTWTFTVTKFTTSFRSTLRLFWQWKIPSWCNRRTCIRLSACRDKPTSQCNRTLS